MNEENETNWRYRRTEWRDFVSYRFDEVGKDIEKLVNRLDHIVEAGIVTPSMLDGRLKDQREACASQFKKLANHEGHGKDTAFSFAKWSIKEFGIFGVLALMIIGLLVLLFVEAGIIGG